MSLPHAIVRELLGEPMSLASLQQATLVSLPTLRRAVQELTDARWIRVVGQASTRGGRPASLFGLDSSRHLLAGVHLQLPGMRLVTSDLTCQVHDEEKLFDRVVPTPDQAVMAVVDYVDRMRAAFPDRAVLGIGIATPGFTDPSTGDILAVGRVPAWENLPVCRRLQAATGLPVRIANDVDCMAFAEFLHANEAIAENVAYIGYDEEVKASLFLKGELHRGSLGNAGLIGSHLLAAGDSLDRQDVRALLTVDGVNRRLERQVAALSQPEQQPYAQLLCVTNPRERFRMMLHCEEEEMPVCRDIVRDVTLAVAAAVANIILVIQPGAVVVGGLLGAMTSARFAELEASVRRHLPKLIGHSTLIRQGRVATHNAAAIGAAHHFLQLYLSDATTALSLPVT